VSGPRAAGAAGEGRRPGSLGPPDDAALLAAALAGLPELGPRRLLALLRRWPPAEAWERVRAGDVGAALPRLPPAVAAAWRTAAARCDLPALAAALAEQGVAVHVVASPGYPARLADDPDPPPVLFVHGSAASLASLAVLDGPTVAVVGTRRCTPYGRDVAAALGRDLALAGVAVVSGLALGVDGAAHEGALVAGGAPPVAVVGSGLDVVYPRQHARLWGRVAAAGAVLTEAPLGAGPEAWRFPLRNRVIAGLADVVVVVESHERGGSRHTVDAAIERGRTVMAVPGSVRSPASAGTNALLRLGAAPLTSRCWPTAPHRSATSPTSSWPSVSRERAPPGRRGPAGASPTPPASPTLTGQCSRPWGGSRPRSTRSSTAPSWRWAPPPPPWPDSRTAAGSLARGSAGSARLVPASPARGRRRPQRSARRPRPAAPAPDPRRGAPPRERRPVRWAA
jgi:DNA processing protein